MQTIKSQVTRMAVRTWSWLKVNETDMNLILAEEEKHPQIVVQASEAIIIKKEIEENIEDTTKEFTNDEITAFFNQPGVVRYHIIIPENHKEEQPIKVLLSLDEDLPVIVEDIVIEARKNSSSHVIFEYTSMNESKEHTESDTESHIGNYTGSHTGRTRVILHEGGNLNLARAQLFSHQIEHSDWFGASLDKEAKLTMIQAELGSTGAKTSWNIVLDGEKSEANLDILYVGEKEKKLDFSSRVAFLGEESKSLVRARGILLGKSKKIFRDSLDFIRGSHGAVGREEEDVLMLSNKARNISVPLLFCGEDDVQGEHAASSGRPNESLLFYLMSRGMSEAEAKKLLAESKFAAILEQVSEEVLRERILSYLRKAIEKEEAHD